MTKLEPSENIKHLITLSHQELVFRLCDHVVPSAGYVLTDGKTNMHRLNKYTLAVLITLLRDAA